MVAHRSWQRRLAFVDTSFRLAVPFYLCPARAITAAAQCAFAMSVLFCSGPDCHLIQDLFLFQPGCHLPEPCSMAWPGLLILILQSFVKFILVYL